MKHRLTFSVPHLSLEAFPTVELPQFVLITGVNGAGKSHLLRAIERGAIKSSAVDAKLRHESRYFDWSSLNPPDASLATEDSVSQQRVGHLEIVREHVHRGFENLRKFVRQNKLPEKYNSAPWRLAEISIAELKEAGIAEGAAEAFRLAVLEQIKQLSNQVVTKIPQPGVRRWLVEVQKERSVPVLSFSMEQLAEFLSVTSGEVNLFQHSFSQMFFAYRNTKLANDLKEYARAKGRTDAQPLSDSEFETRFGPPPWQFVNAAFERAGLDFAVNEPDPYKNEPFTVILRKKSTGVTVPFSALSSGEKVLMSFATCLYYASDKRQVQGLPSLLLLDEIDAPLHPLMSRQVLAMIKEAFVERYGIPVIATTHSPTTIALAPEESLYVMKVGQPGLHKTTKNEALGLLLRDVPMLSLDFSGRRQVFVESDADAEVYERCYRLLRGSLKGERSLTFIGAGPASSGGSSQVTRVIRALSDGQNRTVLGVLDWDGKNDPSRRIKVLAHGTRNGLENCVFDPLPLALLVGRESRAEGAKLGWSATEPFHEFLSSQSVADLQLLVEKVQDAVLGPAMHSRRVSCQYQGGLTLELREDYLSLDDHALERKIVARFPFLQRYQRAGERMGEMVDQVFIDFPELIPRCLLDLFRELLCDEL